MSDTLHDAFGQTQILQAEGHPEKGVGHFQRCVPFEASTYTCTQAVLAPTYASISLQVPLCMCMSQDDYNTVLYHNTNCIYSFNHTENSNDDITVASFAGRNTTNGCA